MSEELKELETLSLKFVELQGNGLSGNGIDCNMDLTDFDLYLSRLDA